MSNSEQTPNSYFCMLRARFTFLCRKVAKESRGDSVGSSMPHCRRQVMQEKRSKHSGLLPVWWTPIYANSAFISNSMGLRYPSVECRRLGL